MILKTFIAYTFENEPIDFKLLKLGSDYRISRGAVQLKEFDNRFEAEKYFKELKNRYGAI